MQEETKQYIAKSAMSLTAVDEVDRAIPLQTHQTVASIHSTNALDCNSNVKRKDKKKVHPFFYEESDDIRYIDDSDPYDSLNNNVDIQESLDNGYVTYAVNSERVVFATQDSYESDKTRLIDNQTKRKSRNRNSKLCPAQISPEVSFCDILGARIIAQSPGGFDCRLPAMCINLSFCGAGFLGIYHLGVAKALTVHGAKLLANVQNFSGASAGILVASVLAIKGPDSESIDRCIKFTFDLAEKSRQKSMGVLTPRFSLLKPLEELLYELCPDNAYEIASGRLHVSLTRLRGVKNITVSQFSDNDHLVQCLLASSYIPFVTGTKIFTINGEKFIDGGMTDNLPRIERGRTVTVSPFSGKENICPFDSKYTGVRSKCMVVGNMSVQLSPDNSKRLMHAFFPPSPEDFHLYYQRGFTDAVRFLKKDRFYSP